MSARHAFVVQFTPDADPATGSSTGRVEHVASGQATHFHSTEELLQFFVQALTEVQTLSSDESEGTADLNQAFPIKDHLFSAGVTRQFAV